MIQKKHFDDKNNRYPSSLILNPPLHTKYEQEELFKKLKMVKKKDLIVDFAAGTGRITIPMLIYGYKVIAVDLSRKSLSEIKKVAKFLGLKKVNFSNKITSNNLAVIVGADALHHVDMEYFLPLFYQKLRKGGKVVFSEPCAWNLSWHIYLRIFHNWEVEKGLLNFSYFNLIRLFQKYKYKNIRIKGFGFFPPPLLNWSKFLSRVNHNLGNLPILKFFAYRYLIEAYK